MHTRWQLAKGYMCFRHAGSWVCVSSGAKISEPALSTTNVTPTSQNLTDADQRVAQYQTDLAYPLLCPM
jgi:hypothetical protein